MPTKDDPLCGRCECPLSKHCKGGVSHDDHKESARMIPMEWRKMTHTCHTRHCLTALCFCPDYVDSIKDEFAEVVTKDCEDFFA